MRTLFPIAMLILSATGCTVYTSDSSGPGPGPVVHDSTPVEDFSPVVTTADAGAYWDSGYMDDIWYFQASVQDPDGVFDVTAVWADVYDEGSGGTYIQSFELYPTNDPAVWYSDWQGATTYLDPTWGQYSVDFVAYDVAGATGYTTVWAQPD